MSNLIASQKVMQHYLSALLTEDEPQPAPKVAPQTQLKEQKKQELNALLSQAVVTQEATVAPVQENTSDIALQELKEKFAKAEQAMQLSQRDVPVAARLTPAPAPVVAETKPPQVAATATQKDYRQGRFQALFFEIAGLKVAVPLKELGGIHQMGPVNSLFGKPDWYKGVMLYREQKINTVDTARWVMPEKYDQTLQQKLNYQYVIMLSDSDWGLMAENLVDTVVLQQDQVKWLDSPTKRPWLAGLVKDQMCALLDVESLIQLLNEGSGINQVD